MQPLPIDPYLPRITGAVKDHGALVLVGPPGSGKTTRVPPAILEAGPRDGRVLLLQPRRIAARAAASRIAEEHGWKLGEKVGYTVRFENRSGPRTRIHVITEGILTRRLQRDPFLEGVSAVILDEFHERSIHSDLALALLREIRVAGRGDLAVLVLSATLDPEPVSRYLESCPVITTEGRPHPVEIRHVAPQGLPDPARLPGLVASALREAWSESGGHTLVFLPGIGEIRRTSRELEHFARSRGAALLQLHGGLSLEEQQRALSPSTRRKIVLSTNVAETSLTIEDVDLVIDSGYARILRNDPRHGIDRLELTRISRHSAEQRSGRAGRVGPGKAIRLWSLEEHQRLAESEMPEVRRVDLSGTVLELRAWGVTDPAGFDWFEAPEPTAIERAESLLEALRATEEPRGPLTDLGQALLEVPAHPRIARLLVGAHRQGLLREGALLGALIEERDILPLSPREGARVSQGRPPLETAPSDLLLRMDLLLEAERHRFRPSLIAGRAIDTRAARAVARTRDVLSRQVRSAGLRRSGKPPRDTEQALLRLLLQCYPDRLVRRRAPGSERGRMVGGRGVVLSPESVVRDGMLFLAIELDESPHAGRAEARVHLASAVRREWVEQDLGHAIEEHVETVFDPQSGKVRSTAALCYHDLPLEEPRDRPPPPEEAQKLLADAVRERAAEIFEEDAAARAWLARVELLANAMPGMGFPSFDADFLAGILEPACAGKTSLTQVRKSDLCGLLRAALPHRLARIVEEQAPETITVPSGSRIRLEYEPGRPPVLAVRLQELFGLADTPTVAGGRVRVLLHILGPNYRPVQVTQDLESFWNTTYARVRKDLRGRYPKHSWPEDPWRAEPTRSARKRRRD